MTAFARQIATAKRLIAKNGQTVQWRQVRDAAPADPLKPWLASGNATNVDTDVKIAFLPNKRVGFETLIAAATGAEILTGSVIGYMAAVSFEPSKKDIVLRGGVVYRISKIDELNVDGAPILYTITFDI